MNPQYAIRFSVVPESGDCTGTLSIAVNAKNYAGKQLAEEYSAPLTSPVVRPESITAGSAAVVLHETSQVSVTLQPGISGAALTVESLTPRLVSVSSDAATTDSNGTAHLSLTGKLPGTGMIRVTEPVSGLSTDISVQIVLQAEDLPDVEEPEKPDKVTASLADGTAVTSGMALDSGTQITLSTATEGATIRYTLDDTCPCKDTALTYSGPIPITADTVLRAAAVKDGVYSDTIRLVLTVKTDDPDDTPDEPDEPDKPSGGGGGGSSRPNTSVDGNGGTVDITPEPVPDGPWENPFTDIPDGAWYEDAAQFVYENGLMAGTSDTTFSPDTTTTRGMIVAILWRMNDSPVVSYPMNFADVNPAAYYGEAVRWATSLGITSGYGDGNFGPDDAITREQFAAILYRYAQGQGYDVSAAADLSGYTDANSIGAYALAALQWANAEGIVSGTSDTTLSPQGQATRAQAAAMLMRFCERFAEK